VAVTQSNRSGVWISHRAVDRRSHCPTHPEAHGREDEPQLPDQMAARSRHHPADGPAPPTRPQSPGDAALAEPGVAAHFKKAKEQEAKIILIDETGILMRPLVRRSLAPRGHPMVVRYQSKHRQKISVQGALVLSSEGQPQALRCQMHEDSYVDGQKTADFLRKLLAEFHGPLIVVWDRGNMHRGPFIRELLEQFPRLSLEQLPSYCPDLNPIEWLWSWIKYCELVNLCPRDLRHLASELAKTLVRGAENTTLQENFVRAAGLTTAAELERAIAA